MFYIFAHTIDNMLFRETNLKTNKRNEAEEMFRTLINNREFQGTHNLATIMHNSKILASHKFDASDKNDSWQGRLSEIVWPAPKPTRNVREAVEFTGHFRRILTTLDVETINHARILGGGNLSLGLRRAVKMATGV